MPLVVTVGTDEPELIAEMVAVEGEVGFIAEMTVDPARLDSFVPGTSAKGRALAEASGDESPEFAVVRVEEGWSNNGRLWDAQELAGIAEQVNALEPVGHWGHINPANVGWEAPEPQTTWLGAVTRDEPSRQSERKGQQVKAFYAAGYNLPNAPIRRYIKCKAVRGVSWLGTGDQVKVPGKGVQVRNFKLSALDWARKLSEGMPSASIVGITSEMEGGQVADLQLAQVSPEQFKQENPNGYALLVAQVSADKDREIAEMQGRIEALEERGKLIPEMCGVLGIDENADMLAHTRGLVGQTRESREARLNSTLSQLLGEKVQDERTRGVVQSLLPMAEMLEHAEDETKIGEMVDASFNSDERIKWLVSNQQGGRTITHNGEQARSSAPAGLITSTRHL